MLSDEVLVDRVLAGFDDAFDELYRRHANAAWRLAQAVTGDAHDAADAVSEAFARVLVAVRAGKLTDGAAFRSYLLTATRNAALDTIRRSGRVRPTDAADFEGPSPAASPADKIAGHEDAVLVAEAFRTLPERWRSVLWLTEVEGVATKDAAEQLGLTPNGTAQLAVRARAGLRERYLQAHVRNHAKPECRFTVEHLGAYVGGAISPRDLAKVDQHLAGCEDCRARKEELEDVGTSLRRIVLPIPLVLGALSAEKVRAALIAATATPAHAGFAHIAQLAKEPTPFMRRVAGASAAGVLALGLLSLGFVDRHSVPKLRELGAPRHVGAPAAAEVPLAVTPTPDEVPFVPFVAPVAATAPPTPDVARSLDEPPTTDQPTTPTTQPPKQAPPSSPTATNPPALPVPLPVPTGDPATVGAGANLGGTTAGVQVSTDPSSTGATVADTPILSGAPVPTTPNSVQVTSPVTGTVTIP